MTLPLRRKDNKSMYLERKPRLEDGADKMDNEAYEGRVIRWK